MSETFGEARKLSEIAERLSSFGDEAADLGADDSRALRRDEQVPALFSASTTRVMTAVFLASASFAVGLWLSTPALTVTLSGVDLMVPLPDMVMVRLGGSLSSASATWPTARAAAARKASVAKRYLRAKDVMGSPASLGVQLYEPARSIPTGQAPLLRSVRGG